MTLTGTDFFQVGIVVPDLEAAMDELGEALNLEWGEIIINRVLDWDVRLVFSTATPYIELVEGPVGSPWDATAGPRLDHLGYWADDPDAEALRLEARGWQTELDGRVLGRSVYYQRDPRSGLRIEMVPPTPEFLARFPFAPPASRRSEYPA